MKQLKAIKKSDNPAIHFQEWFDKVYGNTYYDATVYVGDKVFKVPYQYGSNAGDKQAIDEALEYAGYRVRKCKADFHRPYRQIRVSTAQVKKRDLHKL